MVWKMLWKTLKDVFTPCNSLHYFLYNEIFHLFHIEEKIIDILIYISVCWLLKILCASKLQRFSTNFSSLAGELT